MIEPTDQTGLWIQNKESLEQAYTMELDVLKTEADCKKYFIVTSIARN